MARRKRISVLYPSFVRRSALLCGCLLTLPVQGQDLFSLSLEQLSELKISVADKTPQSPEQSAGIVSVITRQDIQAYGGQNLADVFQRMPSLFVFGSSLMDNMAVSMRGGKLTHTDNWILLLVNGRPLRESHNGGLSSDIYSLFPLEFVERIEVIRGPGSTLYGTNAFVGVINIITQDATTRNAPEVSIGGGSFATYNATVTSHFGDEDAGLAFSAKLLDREGWRYSAADETGTPGSSDREMTSSQLAVRGNAQDFTLDAIVGNMDQFTAGLFDWDLASGGDIPPATVQRRYLNLGYHPHINTDWHLDIDLTYGGHSLEDRSGKRQSRGSIAEINSFYQISTDFNLLSGIVIDNIAGDLNSLAEGGSYNFFRYSTYVQGDYQLTPDLKAIAGVQWNRSPDVPDNVSPRVGLLGALSENWSYKLLYGEAYRNAYAFQQFFQAAGFSGNPALEPELIATYDAQISYRDTQTQLSLGYFHSAIEQAHIRVSDGTLVMPINDSESIRSQGLEFEIRHSLSEQLRVESSLLYQRNKNDSLDDPLLNPHWMAKLGMIYQSAALPLQAGIFDSYFSAAGKLETLADNIQQVNPAAKAYHLLTANIIWQPERDGPIDLTLFLDNLLNKKIYFPDLNRRVVNTLPQHSGRAAYLTLRYRF